MRVPNNVLAAVIAEAANSVATLGIGEVERLPPVDPSPFGGAQTLATGVSHLVESTLARKLGVADALVNGLLRGHAAPVAVALDRVPDAATEEEELTHMLTVAVDIDEGIEHFPAETPSYSRFVWAPSGKLKAAFENSDPLQLVSDLDLMVCIHGLCVRSAAEVMERYGADAASAQRT